jgi:hypothetical protein
VKKIRLEAPEPASQHGRFGIYTVLTGAATCAGATFKPGDFFLAPAVLDGIPVEPSAPNTTLLRSTLPI